MNVKKTKKFKENRSENCMSMTLLGEIARDNEGEMDL